MDARRAVLQRVLHQAPGSIRELADEAGLAHSTLLRAETGERGITPETVTAVLAALRRWAARCEDLARDLEAAEPEEGTGDE